MPKHPSHGACRALAFAALTCSANGALLIYDGFDYGATGGAGFDTITPNGSTIGLAQSGTGSSYANNGTAGDPPVPVNLASGMKYSATGLSFGSLQTSGGSGTFSINGTSSVSQAHITSTTSSTTIWSSFLVSMSPNNGATSNGFEVRLNSNVNSASGSAYLRSNADSRNNSSLPGVAYDNGLTNATGSAITNVPFIIISKFDNIGLTDASAATLWALNSAQFEAFVTAGRTEEHLNGVGNVTAKATDTKTAGTAFSWNTAAPGSSNAYLEIVAGSTTGTTTGTFDEVRYGENLFDVTPVPEPSAALLLCGAAGLGLFRRRRD